MSNKEDVQMQEWAKEVSASLTPAARAAFETLLQDQDGARSVFRGGLREADYYRRLNELSEGRRAYEAEVAKFASDSAQMYGWYEAEAPKNKELLREKASLEARVKAYEQTLRDYNVEVPATPSAPAPATDRKEIEELRQRLQMFDRAVPQLVADLSAASLRAMKEGYEVDPRQIVDFAAQNGVNPLYAFEVLTAEQRTKKQAAATEAEHTKWKEEGRREALSKLPSPEHIRASGPTNFDSITATPMSSRERVDSAVKEFMETSVTQP